ncbi:MAG: rhombosortase [Planctomycetes bacterium]|nr:rhombosortase [Planctomycetota bacterium]
MKHKELKIYIVFIAVFNLGIFAGTVPDFLLFYPEKIMAGQFWRLITHAFVHVSWYHLLLDGAAFLMLYCQLASKSLAVRTFYVAAASIGSMLAAAVVLPYVDSVGYCGLSGIDHGLMTICALEMLTAKGSGKTVKIAGAVSLFLVAAKSIYEAAAGHMFLELLHFNMMGSPVAVSHIGGAAGGLIAFALVYAIGSNVQKMHIAGAINAA